MDVDGQHPGPLPGPRDGARRRRRTRHELLARSARGEWIGAIALSEPDAGSDLAGVSTRAVLEGDEWVVTGRKRWCGNAKAADFIQVLVRERDPEEGESRSKGLVNLLLEKKRGEFPEGLSGYPIDKVGYHGFLTWDLTFDGVRIPKDNVIDEAGRASDEEGDAAKRAGFAEAQKFLNTARVHTAARAVGLARAALEDSILYLQEREQFGHPIGDFQALRFNVAEMAAQIEQSRAFYRQVAHLLDLGVACEKEASMVKLEATEMSVRVTNQAMQLHGGNGYTTERQVERHWRDARLTTIFEGTSEIQKRIISDRLLPREPADLSDRTEPGGDDAAEPAHRHVRHLRADPPRAVRPVGPDGSLRSRSAPPGLGQPGDGDPERGRAPRPVAVGAGPDRRARSRSTTPAGRSTPRRSRPPCGSHRRRSASTWASRPT